MTMQTQNLLSDHVQYSKPKFKCLNIKRTKVKIPIRNK